MHEQSAVKNSFSTYVCYTPDCLFWLNLYITTPNYSLGLDPYQKVQCISLAKGFYLHHSSLWCIHQFRISYFSSANLKNLSDYQRCQQTSPTSSSSAHVVRRGHLDAAAVLAHGSCSGRLDDVIDSLNGRKEARC